mmetsp:Transcript_30768/g.70557  ORF Transcript_30768/g.70557 Transcript_30768/m.70557 type:complete len:263 (-) Transcript_30768:69-857(-)
MSAAPSRMAVENGRFGPWFEPDRERFWRQERTETSSDTSSVFQFDGIAAAMALADPIYHSSAQGPTLVISQPSPVPECSKENASPLPPGERSPAAASSASSPQTLPRPRRRAVVGRHQTGMLTVPSIPEPGVFEEDLPWEGSGLTIDCTSFPSAAIDSAPSTGTPGLDRSSRFDQSGGRLDHSGLADTSGYLSTSASSITGSYEVDSSTRRAPLRDITELYMTPERPAKQNRAGGRPSFGSASTGTSSPALWSGAARRLREI